MGDCLDSTGCTGLPAPVFDHALRSQNWSYNFLSYSVSNGTPFLYYGFEGIFPSGPAYERLFDLTNLGGSNALSEITETGQTYIDGCNGLSGIGYWSDYYERNEHGYRNFSPRKGKWSGNYFYKVNTGTFDVHTRQATIVTPTVSVTANTSAPYWFGDPINFTATAQNCVGPRGVDPGSPATPTRSAWAPTTTPRPSTGTSARAAPAPTRTSRCGRSRPPAPATLA